MLSLPLPQLLPLLLPQLLPLLLPLLLSLHTRNATQHRSIAMVQEMSKKPRAGVFLFRVLWAGCMISMLKLDKLH